MTENTKIQMEHLNDILKSFEGILSSVKYLRKDLREELQKDVVELRRIASLQKITKKEMDILGRMHNELMRKLEFIKEITEEK